MSYELDQRVFNARVEYMSAAIAEITMVCNAAESTDEVTRESRTKLAQLAGDNAQQKFELFLIEVEARQAEADLNVEIQAVLDESAP